MPRRTPRLEISRTVQAPDQGGQAPGGTFGELPKSAQIAALEAQEIVLGKRVIELLEQVERMQQKRIAELTAQVERLEQDRRAADAARRDTPWAVFLRWLEEFWPILVAVPIVAALATGILVWRRRRILENAPSGGLTPWLTGTMSEQGYGDDSLFGGPQTVSSHGMVPPAAAANVGVDTLASHLSEPEDAFDRDIAQQAGSDAKPPHKTKR